MTYIVHSMRICWNKRLNHRIISTGLIIYPHSWSRCQTLHDCIVVDPIHGEVVIQGEGSYTVLYEDLSRTYERLE